MRRLSLMTMSHETVARSTVGAAIGLDVDVLVQVVDRLPALDGDRLAARAQILACCRDAPDDAARIELVGQQVVDDSSLGAVATESLVVLGIAAGDGDQRLPVSLGEPGQVSDGLGVGAHDAGGVFGTFEVAGCPVDVVGDSRQQHGQLVPCTAGWSGSSTSASTIHVSLLPPPCDELTISESLTRATRVSPPAVT